LDTIDSFLARPDVQFIKADAGDTAGLVRLFRERGPFDTVFHMAANSDIQKSAADPRIEFRNTFMTTFSVLEAMRANGTDKLVFCSTSAIYGDKGGAKVAEASGPYLPISYYGGAKLACEGFISAYAHMNDLTASILRFPNVVGDNATHGVIYDFIKRLKDDPTKLKVLGDGKQRKPYLYVKDLIEAILLVSEKAKQGVGIYNIGVDTNTSVGRIAAIVIEEMGLSDVKLEYTGGKAGWKGDVPLFDYDFTKVAALGWQAHRSSDEAVRMAARAILEQWKP